MFRQNFLKACQILLDSSAHLLRMLCQKEYELYGYRVPDRLLERDFSFLADHLSSPRERLVHGNAFPGSFFLYASSHVSVSSIGAQKPSPYFIKRKWAELKVLSWDKNFQEIPDCDTIVVNLVKSKFTKSADENTLYLHREPSRGEKYKRNIDVYFATKKCNAVDLLRKIRNEKIGHRNCVPMSDDEFKELFEDVTKCYEDLEADSGFIQELQMLKPGIYSMTVLPAVTKRGDCMQCSHVKLLIYTYIGQVTQHGAVVCGKFYLCYIFYKPIIIAY